MQPSQIWYEIIPFRGVCDPKKGKGEKNRELQTVINVNNDKGGKSI